jgi:preprotein translocase subunit SecA
LGIALAPFHLQAAKIPVEEAIGIVGKQLLFFYAWQEGRGMSQLPGHGPTDFAPWLAALAKADYLQKDLLLLFTGSDWCPWCVKLDSQILSKEPFKQEATKEFWHIYGLPVLTIPTNRPCIREMLPDSYFADEESKWNAIAEEIVRFHQTGRPLLVGTRSVKASERLAERLTEKGLQFNLLNAVRHKEEAQIVAAAGERGRITIATNMAGRGTDIKLGRSVAEVGGLHVMATERHESGRIDRQLFGRSARQGDPGSAQAFMSVEDELLRRFVPAPLRNRLATALRTHAPGASRLGEAALFYAQRAAERLAYRQRRSVLQQDTWLEEALSFSGPGGEF